jgi:prepilin-type N-terminal cleavage/methylation domain-containing protein/prepilin-type processing-associated H-X9-DG protein
MLMIFNLKSKIQCEASCKGNPKWKGFTLIELLVVVAIIALLAGILLPALTRARQAAIKSTCSAHLHQIGMGIDMYRQTSADKFPTAKYMPSPFRSSDKNPPLPKVLEQALTKGDQVYHCPGDRGYVFDLCQKNPNNTNCGTSYTYNNSLSGQLLDKTWFAERLEFGPADIFVCYDCDGGNFTLDDDSHITVPSFHMLRNLLFADGHVGNYQ